MESIPDNNPSRLLMSKILEDNVENIISSIDIPNHMVAILSVIVEDSRVENIVGSLITYLLDEHYEIEVRVVIEDAFSLTQIWPKIQIAGFEIHFDKEIFTVKGPLKVSALRVQDIDQRNQMCVLAMKLSQA